MDWWMDGWMDGWMGGWIYAGASIHPEAMMQIPHVSDFPYFRNISQSPWKIFKILHRTFSEKLFNFHPPKFLMTFF